MPQPVKVFSSRDFRSYRPVASPVSLIANRFYEFVSGPSLESSHARYAYATAYLGHEPKPGEPFVGSQLDLAVRDILSNPPVIVLAQGPMQPWGLLGPEFDIEKRSLASTTSSTATGVLVEPITAIFLPWSVHQALKDATDGNDVADMTAARFFLMAGIIHETAHWIAANRHGYKPDAERQRSKTSLIPKLNFGKAKIVQHSRKDWGTHAKELLLGWAYTFIAYADGSHEVVCQRVNPIIPKLRPALSADTQMSIVGGDLPEMPDVSKYGAPALREAPKWRPNSDFLIVSCLSPDAACHHGACRLRS